VPATIAAARAGATTGEWSQALRDVFGSYRAPTGVGEAAGTAPGEELEEVREEVEAVSEQLGRRIKILVGKPASTGTPTAPSRSPCAPATRAWTSSTRASG
jgi:(2R)-ethylmalonyl-CoA mutase